jgi:Tfp pilus assembly protein PilF
MSIIDNFEKMLASGQDSAMLRYSLGNEYSKANEYEKAVVHLHRAIEHDPQYSAAWKLYGKALVELSRNDEAMRVYEQGIAAAEQKGDIQAAKEMKVFLKRLQKR